MARPRWLSALFMLGILTAGLLVSQRVLAQSEPRPLAPDPLRAVLPTSSDLPGFQQVLDSRLILPGSSEDNGPRGVLRAFAGAASKALAFELYHVADETLAAVQPSTAGESLLRTFAGEDSRTEAFRPTGSLGIGDDDLSAVWNSYDRVLKAWSVVYADVFLVDHVLGIVVYAAPSAAVDPAALGIYARLLQSRLAAPPSPSDTTTWTLQAEQTIVVGEAGGFARGARSAVRTWFAPGIGWRMEIDSADTDGERHSIFGSDGTTDWDYNPATNRYTLDPATPFSSDPRIFLAGELGPAGTIDLASALAALQRRPDRTLTLEGTEVVGGRSAQVVLRTPYSCSGNSVTATLTPSGTTTTTSPGHCQGSVRYWLDTETGWALRAEGDDGDGGGFSVDTTSVAVDSPIDTALFQFTPPPGSVQEDATGAENGPPSGTQSPPPATEPLSGTRFTIVATDNAFSATQLSAPAGQQLTLTLRNDGKALHNWHLLGVQPAVPNIKTSLVATGNSETITFTVTVPGTYTFQCDVHPSEQRGVLVISAVP